MSQIAKFASVSTLGSTSILGSTFATLGLLLFAATTFSTVGCNQSPGVDAKAVAAYRTSFTLAEEPDDVQTVADVRATLLGETAEEHDHDHAHGDHDHDGDGVQDHEAADHDDHAHEEGHAHEEHDDHDHDAHDDHAHDDHEGHAHDEHDHEAHAHDEHDHHDPAQATEPQAVVMVGNIGGLANPWANTRPEYPFAKTQAIFYLSDPQAIVANAESGHVHAPGEECAFCAANAEDQADMIAMVQFVDKNGKVLPMDVRKMFQVKEGDMVVVHGKAHVTAGGILVINAEGLYVRE